MKKTSSYAQIIIAVTALLATTTTTTINAFSFSSSSDNNSRRSFLKKTASTASVIIAGTCAPFIANAADATATSETAGFKIGGKLVAGDDKIIMSPKAHGTSEVPVQENLRYGVSNKLSDKICNFNRHFAESGGYFTSTSFEETMLSANGPITFYDSNSGKPLFVAPINRPVDEFIEESKYHGWPSFRDEEVVWDNVRVLKSSGETVSVDGTHLGHNLPDRRGNRYCINLVSIAGNPV